MLRRHCSALREERGHGLTGERGDGPGNRKRPTRSAFSAACSATRSSRISMSSEDFAARELKQGVHARPVDWRGRGRSYRPDAARCPDPRPVERQTCPPIRERVEKLSLTSRERVSA
jgi:hypothetical protein